MTPNSKLDVDTEMMNAENRESAQSLQTMLQKALDEFRKPDSGAVHARPG